MYSASVYLAFILVVAFTVVSQGPDEAVAIAAGDECSAADGTDCALNALQHGGRKLVSVAEVSAEAEAGAGLKHQEQVDAEAVALAEMEVEAALLEAAGAAAEANAESLRALLSPRVRYNSSAPGGRRAPVSATQYEGFEDERHFQVNAAADGYTHVFAVGDWGATLPGHYTAPNKRGPGQKCPENCGYVQGVDNRAQILVANIMKQRAATSDPQYVLNVGDNLYWSGIPQECTSAQATSLTSQSFAEAWQGVYGGLANKPWISTLGNHDYGGYQFNHGWPQQIGYSFVNSNWVMPGRYYSKKMFHPGFTVEYFIIDSNAYDAKDPDEDPMHNLCSREHNPANANCAAGGGPTSVADCKSWFWSTYNQQKGWLQTKLAGSSADWQIVITHFPCGTDAGFYSHLHRKYGLDLLVTGHRHDQELWLNSGALGGLSCFVTGGGGGITSESPPNPAMSSTQYGFFDLTMSKTMIKVELLALNGNVIREGWVYPK